MIEIEPSWLAPTWFIDSDSAEVESFANDAVGDAEDPTTVAIGLFYAVRDGLWYDPYGFGRDAEQYRASAISRATSAWCVPKAVLLTAAARQRGIPARLGFADVRNHLASDKLRAALGTELFAWHGYSELLLEGRWVKLSAAFNVELCERFGVETLEFDGSGDALMHPFDRAGNRHMEYVRDRGSHDDLPLDAIFDDFREIYPSMNVDRDGSDEAFARPEEAS